MFDRPDTRAAARETAVAERVAPRGRGSGLTTPAAPSDEASAIAARLRSHGLRPTRQRIDLAHVLHSKGDRHVSAEAVYEEALGHGISVSLATVYNTLKQFTEAGLLVELAVSGAKSFFDTRVDPHHHFYVEGESAMIDVAADEVEISRLPEPPEGMEIVGWDVVVRVRRKA